VGIYHQGNWFDLCRGPHVQSTGQIKSFKILHTAGAYWRGNEKNPMLQRIYATAFKDKKELEEYLHQREEANKRDHRKLGREMGLFIHHPWAPGSPFFTGKGAIIYNELLTYIRDLYFKYGYQEVITPQIFDTEMFKVSGHYQHYKESMYFSHLEEREFGSKPMNCPGHCLLFASEKHSYRELPMRIADFGRLHRYERSGAMHGITRVRSFCQDDAHIFCSLDGLQEEIRNFVELLNEVYNQLGIGQYKVLLATRPESRMGTDEVWDKSEGALANALKALNVPFEYAPGEGAFYGPKLEFHMVDAIKRSWQMGTIQVDYNLPEAFDLKFTGVDNKEHRPVMLHRAVLGSLERFIGVYLEHMSGHLPLWLAPEQVAILNVTDRVNDYCESLQKELRSQKVRAEFDYRNEKLNYKIREAQMRRVPLMFIIGDKEKETGTVSVRFANGKMQSGLDQKQVIAGIYREIKNRSLEIRF
ncbi:MAG TPA: threonine--tRNA ligase, partial [Pseudobdellovibrionaceae bacterium]|nr:threonine--tRNA ligase [Pseudobdellovibrionaceae bacterium]